nr:BA14K family protein [uncultured Cohaesibacter sp.]
MRAFVKWISTGLVAGFLALGASQAGASPDPADGYVNVIRFHGVRVTDSFGKERVFVASKWADPGRVFMYPKRLTLPSSSHRGRHVTYKPVRAHYIARSGHIIGSPEWVADCARRYKSFNVRTGKYLARSGKYRFCN